MFYTNHWVGDQGTSTRPNINLDFGQTVSVSHVIVISAATAATFDNFRLAFDTATFESPVSNNDDVDFIVGGAGTANEAGVLSAYNDFEVSIDATDFTAWRTSDSQIWFTKLIVIGEASSDSADDPPLAPFNLDDIVTPDESPEIAIDHDTYVCDAYTGIVVPSYRPPFKTLYEASELPYNDLISLPLYEPTPECVLDYSHNNNVTYEMIAGSEFSDWAIFDVDSRTIEIDAGQDEDLYGKTFSFEIEASFEDWTELIFFDYSFPDAPYVNKT